MPRLVFSNLVNTDVLYMYARQSPKVGRALIFLAHILEVLQTSLAWPMLCKYGTSRKGTYMYLGVGHSLPVLLLILQVLDTSSKAQHVHDAGEHILLLLSFDQVSVHSFAIVRYT